MTRHLPSLTALRVGYVPLLDAAPLIAAVEMGFCARHGVAVRLMRQVGWANVRDHVIFGELDAAHAPAGLLFAINAGLAAVPARCLTGFIFNTQGNAITLSMRLHSEGIRDLDDLARYALHARQSTPLTLGVVSRYSTHAHLLREWLSSGGIRPDKDARIVVLPPPQMARCLAAGHIDGFCVGEPWNTVAAVAGNGWPAARGAALAPGQPEKVLLVREDFAQRRQAEHLALIAALAEAAEWCAQPAHRQELVRLLRAHAFPQLTSGLIERSLASPDAPLFTGPDLHRPAPAKASWIVSEMVRHRLLRGAVTDASLHEAFRSDLFDHALSTPNKPEPALLA